LVSSQDLVHAGRQKKTKHSYKKNSALPLTIHTHHGLRVRGKKVEIKISENINTIKKRIKQPEWKIFQKNRSFLKIFTPSYKLSFLPEFSGV